MSQNYGTKRIVSGAHYGLRDWMAQRVTAVLMALFTVVLLAQVIFGEPVSYYKWAGIFSQQWMKTLTFVVILSILYHVWVGIRDIFMDYINPWASAWHCMCLPSCGSWAAPAGPFKCCGDCKK